jgi:hypothetical protein
MSMGHSHICLDDLVVVQLESVLERNHFPFETVAVIGALLVRR